MKSTRRVDTGPERALRSELHRRGLRYRVDRPVLNDRRRRVDIVFSAARLAVFVDGCFWHGCPKHGTLPRANAAFWRKKIERNQERDRDTNDRMIEAGWRVIRVWEHEDPKIAAERIEGVVRQLQ